MEGIIYIVDDPPLGSPDGFLVIFSPVLYTTYYHYHYYYTIVDRRTTPVFLHYHHVFP